MHVYSILNVPEASYRVGNINVCKSIDSNNHLYYINLSFSWKDLHTLSLVQTIAIN